MSEEQTYTYKLTLSHSAPWVGCESEDTFDLEEFGYSDQEWDSLPFSERNELLDEWAQENFWNSGYEFHGDVERG